MYADEFVDGVYVAYVVECRDQSGDWEVYSWSGRLTTPESAFKKMRGIIRSSAKWDRDRAKEDWERNHPSVQEAQLIQQKVTAKTTDKQIQKMAGELSAARDRLTDITKPPKFKWERPDYESRFRVSKRTMTYRSEIISERKESDVAKASADK
jgi:hypothetical protein